MACIIGCRGICTWNNPSLFFFTDLGVCRAVSHIFTPLFSCCAVIFSCFLYRVLQRCYYFCWLTQLWPVEGRSWHQEELDSCFLSQQPSLHLPPTHLLAKLQLFYSIQKSMCLCLQETMFCPDLIFCSLFPIYYIENKTKVLGSPSGLSHWTICHSHFSSMNLKVDLITNGGKN